MKVFIDERQFDRRTGIERRSVRDTRPSEERETQGERRSGVDRRKGGDRRTRPDRPALQQTIFPAVLGLCALCLYDVAYHDGEHTLRPLQEMADRANYLTDAWMNQAFRG